jgi:uncharacterized protein YaiI (UPF0178 family)
MKIWVDADACPVPVKEILFRAAERQKVEVTLVANQRLSVPQSTYVRMLQVEKGFDVADNEIVRRIEAGDLLISSDIPLASEVLEKGALVITPRGERYTEDNIKARLNIRDFMETLRSSGIQSGGQPTYSQADRMQFANQLDRILAKRPR